MKAKPKTTAPAIRAAVIQLIPITELHGSVAGVAEAFRIAACAGVTVVPTGAAPPFKQAVSALEQVVVIGVLNGLNALKITLAKLAQ
jgi:hypothetical protein